MKKYNICLCGGKYKSTTKYTHYRTKRHILYTNTIDDDELTETIRKISEELKANIKNYGIPNIPNKYMLYEKVKKQFLQKIIMSDTVV